ncbi:MAG: GNAT family N-acetyltransferase [Nocardioidaceae bacterium]|nr:GNAT family N-acetyltransferase [Nocardioidaceae bacterium]
MDADHAAAVATGLVWVAEQGQRVVGLLVLEIAHDHALIENVAVSPDAQGLGVGSRLLALAEQQAGERGLREVRLYTHEAMTENQEYYRRRGYRETHRSRGSGFQRVFFTKDL